MGHNNREKPHFLFLGYKWHQGNPACGPNNCSYFTWDTLDATGFGTYDVFFIDERYRLSGDAVDEEIICECEKIQPDYFIFIWWPNGPENFNPKLETIYTIREKLSIPVISIWPDTWEKWIIDIADIVVPFCDLAIVTDSIQHFKNSKYLHKYIELIALSDTRIFYDPELIRDIRISFNGGFNSYKDRIEGIEFLRRKGINVLKTGGQLEDRLPLEEYSRIFMRSKIALNFTTSGNRKTKKGRLLEATLCGAMLLESRNNETNKWFKPYVEYVPFDGKEDLLQKAKYYLENDAERIAIANNGKKKAQLLCTGEQFWGRAIQKIKYEYLYDSMEALIHLKSYQLNKNRKRSGFKTSLKES